VLKVGQQVEVYVLGVDHERKRIALSLKRLEPEPWVTVESRYYVDQLVEGTITRLANFGAFALVGDEIEGLIHISELSDGRINHPQEVINEGEKHVMRIIRIDPRRRRMGLSLKRVADPAYADRDWKAELAEVEAPTGQDEGPAEAVEPAHLEILPEPGDSGEPEQAEEATDLEVVLEAEGAGEPKQAEEPTDLEVSVEAEGTGEPEQVEEAADLEVSLEAERTGEPEQAEEPTDLEVLQEAEGAGELEQAEEVADLEVLPEPEDAGEREQAGEAADLEAMLEPEDAEAPLEIDAVDVSVGEDPLPSDDEET
jgi:predicted RNA-binding protein with RPS1 domain